MDDHNVHHFWGLSPAVDLLQALGGDGCRSSDKDVDILQVSPYDFRHTITTISRARRHSVRGHVHLYVYEDHAEGLARHMLLIAVLLDSSLTARERMEMVLELHGNALIRDKAADYLDSLARQLEDMVTAAPAKLAALPLARQLSQLLNLSLLRYQERDELVEALHKCRKTVAYDMVKAWDARCRRWYHDRYDARVNLVDWDYQMRLAQQGSRPAEAPLGHLGHIIHWQHFREWRLHGVAHELRDCVYNQPNRSLLSTAVGRTKEFKDRSGRDVGRSVSAWGYWGEVVNPPYHGLGTTSEEPAFFKVANKQYTRTAVDVAQHNTTALLHELRSGQRYVLEGDASRAAAQQGPTSLEELEAMAVQQEQQEQQEASSKQQEQDSSDPAGTSASCTADAAAAELSKCSISAAEGSTPDGAAAAAPAEPPGAAGGTSSSSSSAMQAEEEKLRAAEAQLDQAAWQHLQRFTIHFLTGDFAKAVSGRSKFCGKFSAASMGHRHIHLLGPEHKLAAVLRPGAPVVAESGLHMVQLNKEQSSAFADKMDELAKGSGLSKAERPAGVAEAHVVYVKASTAAAAVGVVGR